MSNNNVLAVLFLAAFLLTACTTNPYTGEEQASNAAKGAAIGAAAGAVVGVLSGDDADERRKNALIGAGVGTLAGGAVGAYMDAQEAKLREQNIMTDAEIKAVHDEIAADIEAAVQFAEDSPMPDPSTITEDVYA